MRKAMALTALCVCLCLLVSCGKAPGEMTLSAFLKPLKEEAPRVVELFPAIDNDSPLITESYLQYDGGQFVGYVNCVFETAADYADEAARLTALASEEAYVQNAKVDHTTVDGALKISLEYPAAVEAFMFDSGLLTYALCYEEEMRIVYVAVSENPLYTYSQFVPEPYLVTADLEATAKEMLQE